MPRPVNLIVLIADDHRYEAIGAHGTPVVRTPNLDALAARGTDCIAAHCQGGMHGAICVPSRASLMTGRHIFASSADPAGRVFRAAQTIPEELPTFPQLLREAGYHTHAIGKWHNDEASFARSFTTGERLMFGGMSDHDRVPLRAYGPEGVAPETEVRYEPGFSTDLFAEAGIRFLREYDRAEPFCLYVAFTAPHDPRTPPPGFAVDPETIPPPPNWLPVHPFDNGEMVVRDERLEAFPRTEGAVRQHIADYYGMITHLDAAIGEILAALAISGRADETVVVYTADHGLAVGQHGLMGKQNLYQHSLHVPLIFAGPGIPAGQRVVDLVWHGDTTATLLALAGAGAGTAGDGLDLLPAMRDEARDRRRTLGAAYRFGQRMIRDDRYKLIRYYPALSAEGSVTGSLAVQMFDLDVDPWETANLAHLPELRPVRDRLDGELAAWQRDVGDPLLELPTWPALHL